MISPITPILLSACVSFIVILFGLKIFASFANPARDFTPKTEGEKSRVSPFGGILMFASAFIVFLCFAQNAASLLLFAPVFAMLILGLADDLKKLLSGSYKGISAKMKFGVQSIVSIFTCYFAYSQNQSFQSLKIILPFFGVMQLTLPLTLAFVISFFAITGTANALNLTDGLDGLAGKQALILLTFLWFFALFYPSSLRLNSADFSLFLAVFMGAVIGFLFFNVNPAKIFMGDAGSMMLGSAISLGFVMLRLEAILPFLGFVIFMEALSVILQVGYFKITGGKRIFRMSPLHHHFQLCGWKEQKITEVAALISILLAISFVSGLFLTSFPSG